MPGIAARIEAFPRQCVSSGAQVLSFREAGDGVPVVLLHGIGSGSGSWLYQLEQLRSEFRVIAWDAPGYGQSTPLPGEHPRACDYAEALGRLVDAKGLSQFHLVGHSLGALIAAAFCRVAPDRVRSLSLIDPAIGYGALDPAVRRDKLAERLRLIRELGPEGLAEARAKELVSEAASSEALELVKWNMSRLSVRGYSQAASMLASGNLLEEARRLDVPVLVLCGSRDRITPETVARQVAQAYGTARYVSLPALGHASYVEGPEIVNAYLTEVFHGGAGAG